MPRKEQGWITFQTSEDERKILEEFCHSSQRTKTEVLRELLRNLTDKSSQSPIPTEYESEIRIPTPEKPIDTNVSFIEASIQKKPLKVSSRNLLKGVVTEVKNGPVNSEVTLEVVHKVKLTSVITRVSADELELDIGKEAYAVIKSTDIVIASE
ncbi:TOBE domain-containing protein [Rivularia sp. IAM M-261]|nr:TOBE domain-containing protein [Rivularia sp. IAM M-261]